eukprot:scaffold31982_cov30-Tisochrysis_lutea.AAC.1
MVERIAIGERGCRGDDVQRCAHIFDSRRKAHAMTHLAPSSRTGLALPRCKEWGRRYAAERRGGRGERRDLGRIKEDRHRLAAQSKLSSRSPRVLDQHVVIDSRAVLPHKLCELRKLRVVKGPLGARKPLETAA